MDKISLKNEITKSDEFHLMRIEEKQQVDNFIYDEIIEIIEENNQRINIILDLDSTLVFASAEGYTNQIKECNNEKIKYSINNSNNENLSYSIQNSDKNIFDVSIPLEGHTVRLRIQIRKFVVEMLLNLNSFCDFYIYTLGRTPYANEVIKILKELSKFK